MRGIDFPSIIDLFALECSTESFLVVNILPLFSIFSILQRGANKSTLNMTQLLRHKNLMKYNLKNYFGKKKF